MVPWYSGMGQTLWTAVHTRTYITSTIMSVHVSTLPRISYVWWDRYYTYYVYNYTLCHSSISQYVPGDYCIVLPYHAYTGI